MITASEVMSITSLPWSQPVW